MWLPMKITHGDNIDEYIEHKVKVLNKEDLLVMQRALLAHDLRLYKDILAVF